MERLKNFLFFFFLFISFASIWPVFRFIQLRIRALANIGAQRHGAHGEGERNRNSSTSAHTNTQLDIISISLCHIKW